MSKLGIRVIPYSCGLGAQKIGCYQGPAAADQYGLVKAMQTAGLSADWLHPPQTILELVSQQHKNPAKLGDPVRNQIVLQHCQKIAADVEGVIKNNFFPVVFGGDHSVSMGSIAGLARATGAHGKIGVIWIDAHGDIHTPQTSPSKALHGMSLAHLMGYGFKEFSGLGNNQIQPVLKPENLIYLGPRDLEAEEDEFIRSQNIDLFSTQDLQTQKGAASAIDSIGSLADRVDHLVVSIDMDVYDPRFASSVGTESKNGLKPDDLMPILTSIGKIENLAMVEIVEFNPALGNAKKTFGLALQTLNCILKEKYSPRPG